MPLIGVCLFVWWFVGGGGGGVCVFFGVLVFPGWVSLV